MCIGFWSLEHPDYALILCSNRDEFLARPTSAAHWHAFESGPSTTSSSTATDNEDEDVEGKRVRVLSGRDLRAGGTWLGISRDGNVAFLTNITEPLGLYASTRGELTSSFLLSRTSAATLDAYTSAVVQRNASYAGFNLLLLSPSCSPSSASPPSSSSSSTSSSPPSSSPSENRPHWQYTASFLTNHTGGGPLTSRPLSPATRRVGGLSNGIDGHGGETWPKVVLGSQMFADVLESHQRERAASNNEEAETEEHLIERLFDLLTYKPPTTPLTARDTIQIPPHARQLSPLPDAALYGTRLSNVILVRRDGGVVFVERDVWMLDPHSDGKEARAVPGERKKQRVFRFTLEAQGRS
ncbi:DUF833-domain-containing protein [Trametopsis cervina]|nr:DUF833-domain-containing protein [Trametopsis cervina]